MQSSLSQQCSIKLATIILNLKQLVLFGFIYNYEKYLDVILSQNSIKSNVNLKTAFIISAQGKYTIFFFNGNLNRNVIGNQIPAFNSTFQSKISKSNMEVFLINIYVCMVKDRHALTFMERIRAEGILQAYYGRYEVARALGVARNPVCKH